jgi:folylpolyglutamate synthase/dihydropteroate synthase
MTVLADAPLVLTDAAHPPAAVAALAAYLAEGGADRRLRGRCTLLLATAAKKCLPEIVGPLAELATRIVVTEASYRAAPADSVAALVRELGHGAKIAAVEPAVDAALKLALADVSAEAAGPPAAKEGGEVGWLLGAGGLFLTADLLRLFGADLTQL